MKIELIFIFRLKHDCKVHAIAAQQFESIHGVGWFDIDEALWIFGLKLTQHGWQYILAGGRARANAQSVAPPFAELLERAACGVHLSQNSFCMMEQGLAGLGEQHLFAHPV